MKADAAPDASLPASGRGANARSRQQRAGEWIAALLGVHCRDVRRNAERWLATDDAEALHRVRVGLRRLRAVLSMARKYLPGDAVAAARREARDLASALGPVRDLDVFTRRTLPAIDTVSDRPTRSALRRLGAAAASRRRLARTGARAALSPERIERFVADVESVARACEEARSRRLAHSAKRFARRMLKRRHRRVAEQLPGIVTLGDEKRHALRIAAKQLRYTAEAFRPLFARGRFEPYRRALADLQTALGDLRDAAAAPALAHAIDAQSGALDAIAAWSAACRERQARGLARATRRVEAADRFWRRNA